MTNSSPKTLNQDGWLWASAAGLTAAVLLASAGVFTPSAKAEMTATVGGYTAVTTDGGTDEVLVVTDNRSETLMAYQVLSGKRLELLAKHSLPEMFQAARVEFPPQ